MSEGVPEASRLLRSGRRGSKALTAGESAKVLELTLRRMSLHGATEDFLATTGLHPAQFEHWLRIIQGLANFEEATLAKRQAVIRWLVEAGFQLAEALVEGTYRCLRDWPPSITVARRGPGSRLLILPKEAPHAGDTRRYVLEEGGSR